MLNSRPPLTVCPGKGVFDMQHHVHRPGWRWHCPRQTTSDFEVTINWTNRWNWLVRAMELNRNLIYKLTERQIYIVSHRVYENKRHFDEWFWKSFDSVRDWKTFHGKSIHSNNFGWREREQEIQLDTPLTCKREVCVNTLNVNRGEENIIDSKQETHTDDSSSRCWMHKGITSLSVDLWRFVFFGE